MILTFCGCLLSLNPPQLHGVYSKVFRQRLQNENSNGNLERRINGWVIPTWHFRSVFGCPRPEKKSSFNTIFFSFFSCIYSDRKVEIMRYEFLLSFFVIPAVLYCRRFFLKVSQPLREDIGYLESCDDITPSMHCPSLTCVTK